MTSDSGLKCYVDVKCSCVVYVNFNESKLI